MEENKNTAIIKNYDDSPFTTAVLETGEAVILIKNQLIKRGFPTREDAENAIAEVSKHYDILIGLIGVICENVVAKEITELNQIENN